MMPRVSATVSLSFLFSDRGKRLGKKAIHSLLDRLPGHHVVWWSLEQKEREVKGSSSAAWTAEEESFEKESSL